MQIHLISLLFANIFYKIKRDKMKLFLEKMRLKKNYNPAFTALRKEQESEI